MRTDEAPDPELATLSLAALARRIASGAARAETAVEACLARIAVREPVIHAWAQHDAARARAEARARDAAPRRGPLHGIPVGIKDIIDTADQPTEYGSPIYAGYRPPRDAAAVALLRRAGAVILGKTATTEFAGAHPAATVNPRAPGHTPGGSSSGSAAAVADFMVPAALGTQTLGSIIRPAAFCGIVGFKPTHGLLPLDGVKPSAPTMDTLGFLLRAAEDVPPMLAALAPGAAWLATAPMRPRFVILCGPQWDKALPETRDAIARAADAFRHGGATVEAQAPPTALETLREAAWTILCYENARNWAFEHESRRARLSPVLAGFLDRGAAISVAEYHAALAAADAARREIDAILDSCDAVLTAAVPGEAPAGLASTGDSVFNGGWTLSHAPCATLPAGRGPHGLPVGLQLVARRQKDAELAALLRWAEARLADAAPPA